MKINKETKTIEEITSYEAFDGMKYEESAVAAAKKAAWHYLVEARVDSDIFRYCDDEGLYVFDVPDTTAYEIIMHWGNINEMHRIREFTPSYIGKRVAFYWNEWDGTSFYPVYATKEQMLEFYTEHIEKLFADKEAE